MGNTGSNRRHHYATQPHQPPPAPPRSLQQHQMNQRQYFFAASTPYPSHYQNQNQNQNQPYQHYPGGYYPPMPLPGPYGFHPYPGGRGPPPPPPPQPVAVPYVEHQKAVTIRNDVNVKKETLRVEPDEENPGKFVVAFTFDATAPASITVMFFGKEGVEYNLIATKEDLYRSVTISFQPGIGQKFRQPSGAGIDFSMIDEAVLGKESDQEVFPLIVKAEAHPLDDSGSDTNPSGNSQITMAVFQKKENGEHQARVVKQILWVNRVRYELQEIYGIGNTVGSEVDENDSGKECVICLSEPRDTTVLPCRHMCMCSGCAKVLQFQTNRCPICRQPVDRLLEIKVNNEAADG